MQKYANLCIKTQQHKMQNLLQTFVSCKMHKSDKSVEKCDHIYVQNNMQSVTQFLNMLAWNGGNIVRRKI